MLNGSRIFLLKWQGEDTPSSQCCTRTGRDLPPWISFLACGHMTSAQSAEYAFHVESKWVVYPVIIRKVPLDVYSDMSIIFFIISLMTGIEEHVESVFRNMTCPLVDFFFKECNLSYYTKFFSPSPAQTYLMCLTVQTHQQGKQRVQGTHCC